MDICLSDPPINQYNQKYPVKFQSCLLAKVTLRLKVTDVLATLKFQKK